MSRGPSGFPRGLESGRTQRSDFGSATPPFSGRWLWLFPLTYALHAVEEVWAGGGYAAWITAVSGQPISDSELVVIHAVLIVATSLLVVIVSRRRRFFWGIVAFGVVVTGNAVLHVASSWLTRTYSPGLVTGLLAWAPLGVLTLRRAARTLPRSDVVWGTAIGIVATAVISALALNPSLLPLP